ncbi:MAG: MFS transporter, partial [Bacteroidaceae bacterium]|nr:MFS transporter [Bacteroidaceae bacterium]
GFAIFGVGCEITGITVSKIIAKWFTGHEMALAMGVQVALARIGTAGALAFSPRIAKAFTLSAPILFGTVCLCIGLLAYIVYCVMDKKLDKSVERVQSETAEEDEGFKLRDLGVIFRNPGFWLVTFLCLLFYSGVFPFLKFATKLMIYKYNVPDTWASKIPAILPFGTILLTPLFGTLYDRIGKGATLMIIGSVILTAVHICFALPILNTYWFAIILMILLGIAFSLVPSAMWPSVPKIIPMKQLGSAYAVIFYIQNIGLSLVPVLIGKVIDDYSLHKAADGTLSYDFTIPMAIFAAFGVAAVLIAVVLKVIDKKKGYGLEQANIKK